MFTPDHSREMLAIRERDMIRLRGPDEPYVSEPLVNAFVSGAKWWEWHQTNCTMWQSDQRLAEIHAQELLAAGTLGLGHEEMLARMYSEPEQTK